MRIENLFTGVGLIIDDKINDEASNDPIIKIKSFFEEERKIPLVKFDKLPDDEIIQHISELNFILLDWEFDPIEEGEDGRLIHFAGEALKESNKKAILSFLEKVVENTFIPIFIFSNQSEDLINKELKDRNILSDGVNHPIFVKSKNSVVNGKDVVIFDSIEEWIKQMPSIYVMKLWKTSMQTAITSLMNELLKIDAGWPSILWKAYTKDGVNPSEEIENVIQHNVQACMEPVSFEEQYINVNVGEVTQETLRRILSALCFIKSNADDVSNIGDLYHHVDENEDKYYVNIRPACDCVKRGRKVPDVYWLECKKIADYEEKYNKDNGCFDERIYEAVVGPLFDGNFYTIIFRDLKIRKFKEVKAEKIGRIIPPYITRVAERFASYIQRQGLPRIPDSAVEKE